jgi:hypothetical protein
MKKSICSLNAMSFRCSFIVRRWPVFTPRLRYSGALVCFTLKRIIRPVLIRAMVEYAESFLRLTLQWYSNVEFLPL